MRSRIVKPGLFSNEEMAELPIPTRYLFVALWCLADREGLLEDRPKRIRGEVFPFDEIDLEPMLQELYEHQFIVRYEYEGQRVISIPRWHKHQKCHRREAASILPKYVQGQSKDSPRTRLVPAL